MEGVQKCADGDADADADADADDDPYSEWPFGYQSCVESFGGYMEGDLMFAQNTHGGEPAVGEISAAVGRFFLVIPPYLH